MQLWAIISVCIIALTGCSAERGVEPVHDNDTSVPEYDLWVDRHCFDMNAMMWMQVMWLEVVEDKTLQGQLFIITHGEDYIRGTLRGTETRRSVELELLKRDGQTSSVSDMSLSKQGSDLYAGKWKYGLVPCGQVRQHFERGIFPEFDNGPSQ